MTRGKREFLRRLILTVGIGGLLIAGLFMIPPGENGSRVVGGPMSLLPPLVAIMLAVVWRRVLMGLFIGVLVGAFLHTGFSPVNAVVETVGYIILPTAVDVENLYIFGFTFSLMGMVGILIRNGGIEGVVQFVSRFARGRRSAQTMVALMGTAVFFDDYANTVVVGSSARPLTDRLKVSREKLAYIVDSTAAPIASLAIISTWIGIEIRYLDEQIHFLDSFAATGYGVFLHLIPMRFYCIFAIATVFAIALSGRDFGPMLKAERRALGGEPLRRGSKPMVSRDFQRLVMEPGVIPNAWYGLGPILVVLVAIVGSFFWAGSSALSLPLSAVFSVGGWKDAFSAVTNSTQLLLLAGVSGSLVALGSSWLGGKLSILKGLDAWWSGARSLTVAVVLLILAISLRKITDEEHLATANYVLEILSGTSPYLVPVSVFLTAAAIAFATGTSWGTMGILLPFAVPLAANAAGTAGDPMLLILSTGAVLDGAVFGDHCSPISDTTVLSSIGSMSDLMDHVKTQVPYALLSMTVAALVGYGLMPWFGFSLWASYGLGLLLILGTVWGIGRRP